MQPTKRERESWQQWAARTCPPEDYEALLRTLDNAEQADQKGEDRG